MIEQVFPKKIIYKQNAVVDEKIFIEKSTQIIFSESPLIEIRENGIIIFDFGEEMCGRLHILCLDNSEGEIRVRLGESVAEACAELGENGAGNHHSLRDCRLPILSNADLTTNESGFRFARIDVSQGCKLSIKNVFVESKRLHLENEGCFSSNDEEINRIYEVAKRTLSLCIQNGVVWDGVKRDRAVWIGDFHPEFLSLASIYGQLPEIERVLDQGEWYLTQNAWVNCIPSYSAWWIICLNDYYRHFDKKEYVSQKLQTVLKILSDFDGIVMDDGSVCYDNCKLKIYEENEFFFDWPTNFTKDSYYGWISVVLYACKEAEKLLSAFDSNTSLANSLVKRLSKNSVVDSSYKQVEAFQLLTGRKKPEDVRSKLLENGAQGMTGFMGYYILTAMAQSGDDERILSVIKDFYGGMIACGATTFWEDFDIAWLKDLPEGIEALPKVNVKNIHRDYGKYCYKELRHSLCHGWTSGVIAFFIRTILGIKPIAPAYKKIQIKPKLLGLKSVQGKIITPYGEVFVKHNLVEGKIISEIKVPDGIEVDNDETNIY